MALPPENARKTHCEAGHRLAGANLYVRDRNGRRERVCRACARRRYAELRRRRGYEPRVPKPKPPKLPRRFRAKDTYHSRPAYLRVLDRTDIIEGGCWLWRGVVNDGGYGVIQLGRGKGTTRAHRVTYEHFVGPLVPGLDVMHLCHVPNCVNPAHLKLGTRAENMAMSQDDGRLTRHGSRTRTKTVP